MPLLSQRLTVAALAASLALTPATRVAADAGDALAGALVGGIIGHAIARDQQRRVQTQPRTVYRRPAVSSAQREANRDVQTSLNYFGFPAGSVDGVLGSRSRAAISQYQAVLGYPATGQLTQYERDFLLGSYHRAVAGGAATMQLLASLPQGPRGLLLRYRDEAAGIATAAAPAAPAPVAPVATAPATTLATAEAESTPEPTLPNFMGSGAEHSLASHCNKVALLTSSNGGFTTLASMKDPTFTLGEQFCLARTYAIAGAESLEERIEGFTPEQIAEQCESFGPAMRKYVAELSLKPEAEVVRDVSSFALSTGMTPAQLAGTAKICVGAGYRTDDMDVALGSALLLVALGEPVYGELVGHHLALGFGTAKRADLALAWYETSLDALAAGAQPVFAPGQPERGALIRKAAFGPDTAKDAALPEAPTVQPVAALPSFAISQ